MERRTSRGNLKNKGLFMHGRQLVIRVLLDLKSLLSSSQDTSRKSTRQKPTEVLPQEEISRFVFRSSHISKSQGCVHHTWLIPRRNPNTRRLEVSVCRSIDLETSSLWGICATYIEPEAGLPAIGRCVGMAVNVFAEALSLDPNGEPFFQHADIIGWEDDPSLPDEEKKNYWKAKALKMAPHFKYSPRSGSR